ncbi:MAG TPA: hypothetical protein VKA46_18275 [Gemmataceae bacterium]|nr:hypothetical protein [Gemmataceae bacterium]
MQPPVRIKLYGLFSLTKRAYLIWVGIGLAGLLALLVVWCVTVTPETPLEKSGKLPLNPYYLWRAYAPWLIAGGLLLGGVEAYVVLRRFRRAEAERQQAAAPDTTPKGS